MEGDDHDEAYTAIVQGELLSLEIQKLAEAEAVEDVEGNTVGAAMRGVGVLPGSKTSSCTKGLRRKLGDLMAGRLLIAPVRIGEAQAERR